MFIIGVFTLFHLAVLSNRLADTRAQKRAVGVKNPFCIYISHNAETSLTNQIYILMQHACLGPGPLCIMWEVGFWARFFSGFYVCMNDR